MTTRYVGFADDGRPIHLFNVPGGKKIRQVLWGDFLQVHDDAPDAAWFRVVWAPTSDNPLELFIRKDNTTDERPLEIVFVDVGQGDGAVLITPEDNQQERIVVIDAGEGKNMSRFLIERFGSYESGRQFHAAVITHTDEDHYGGFEPIFDARRKLDPHTTVLAADEDEHLVGFDVVYHSGLLEGPNGKNYERLGGTTRHDGRSYLQDLIRTNDDVTARFGAEPADTRKPFAALMKVAEANPNINNFEMLSDQDGDTVDGTTYLPGFSPKPGVNYSVEVVGPILEHINGAPALRTISSYAKTKNGHSVLLKLEVGAFKVLFGGDLNKEAEKFILTHIASLDGFPNPADGDERADYQTMISLGNSRFGADIMKVCHHGSEKVTDAFLQAVNPAVFVISSGDREGHVHPRPDLLGRLGKAGRGAAPVLLSTELQRSTRAEEDIEMIEAIFNKVDQVADAAPPTDHAVEMLKNAIHKLGRTNVDVYGSIYVKTDGTRLIAAFKKESGSSTDKWFYFHYEFNAAGDLVLVDS